MGNLFDIESALFKWLSKLADRMILNVLFLVSSMPIITIGAAITALYDVTGRIQREEEKIWRDYWKAFRSNFKQATVIWLILQLSALLLGFSVLYYIQSDQINSIVALLIVVIGVFPWIAVAAWVFPLLARFENSVGNTIKNALICGVVDLPKTILITIINCIPVIILLLDAPMFLFLAILWLTIWFAAAAAINMTILKKKIEELETMSSSRM